MYRKNKNKKAKTKTKQTTPRHIQNCAEWRVLV